MPSEARIFAVAVEGPQRRDAGVQDVEPPRTVARQAADDVGGHVARGCERQRGRAGVFEKCRIEVVVQGRGHDHLGGVDDPLRQVLGEREVVAQLQVRSVLLGGGAERHDDDRVGTEDAFRLGPCQIFEPDAWRRRVPLRWRRPPPCVIPASASASAMFQSRMRSSSRCSVQWLRRATTERAGCAAE